MLEIVINVEASALTDALNNLASAISGKAVAVAPVQKTSAPAAQTTPTPAPAPAPVAQPAPAPVAQAAPPPASPVPAPAQQPLPAAGVPVAAAPQYTAEQIMAAGAALMDAGKAQDLVALLHSFGVKAVMELKPEQYGAFATSMRGLGAKI